MLQSFLYFEKKIIFDKNNALKVAHNPPRPTVFNPASFEIFSSLKLSNFGGWKIAYNFYDLGTIAFYYTVLNYLYSAKFCLVQNFEWNLLVLGNISLSVSLEVRKEA